MAAPTPPKTPQGSFPVNGRILRGYGPLAVFAVMLVLMALLVPTKVPQQSVSASDGTIPSAGEGFTSGSSKTSSGATTPGAPGGAAAGAADPAAAGGVASDGQGSGIAPVEGVQACPDRAEQIPGDPYSPPCVAWGGGNNGGATTKGVTGDTILVSYRVLGEKGFQQTLAELAGASLSDTPQTIQNTITAFAQYFNERFQFYGRKIEVQFYDGQGSNTNELLGKGRDRAEADATKVAEEIGSFADLSATSEPYAGALAARGVIGFGTPYLSREWHEQRAPFAWSLATDGTRVSELAAEYGNKRLHKKPAAFAGGDLKGKPRKFATIAPENSWSEEVSSNQVCG